MLRAALQSEPGQGIRRARRFWSPRVVAMANGQHVKVAKVKGEFVWHAHADEDEFFLVRKGTLTIRYRDRPDVVLTEGDFHVVPQGRRAHAARRGRMLGRAGRAGGNEAHRRNRFCHHQVDRVSKWRTCAERRPFNGNTKEKTDRHADRDPDARAFPHHGGGQARQVARDRGPGDQAGRHHRRDRDRQGHHGGGGGRRGQGVQAAGRRGHRGREGQHADRHAGWRRCPGGRTGAAPAPQAAPARRLPRLLRKPAQQRPRRHRQRRVAAEP